MGPVDTSLRIPQPTGAAKDGEKDDADDDDDDGGDGGGADLRRRFGAPSADAPRAGAVDRRPRHAAIGTSQTIYTNTTALRIFHNSSPLSCGPPRQLCE